MEAVYRAMGSLKDYADTWVPHRLRWYWASTSYAVPGRR